MKTFTVIVVAFVTAVLTATGTTYLAVRLGWFSPPEPQKQVVPNLVGLTEADAKTNLGTLGFTMIVEGREPHLSAEPGTVIRQVPAAGQLAGQGQAVNVAFAAALPKVPSVVGRTLSEATDLLQRAGYTVQVGEAVGSSQHAQGLVAGQSPLAGTGLEKGKPVSVQPSAGPSAIKVPRLVGLGLQQAKTEAEKAGLKFEVQWVSLAETTSYVVLRQKPEAGESVAPDSQVLVVVNRGD
jgi:beta-lactam-binding protein with PASTA domain